MGLVYKPEPPPPARASHEEKMAWYHRERARSVATMKRQGPTLDYAWVVILVVGIPTGLALLFGH